MPILGPDGQPYVKPKVGGRVIGPRGETTAIAELAMRNNQQNRARWRERAQDWHAKFEYGEEVFIKGIPFAVVDAYDEFLVFSPRMRCQWWKAFSVGEQFQLRGYWFEVMASKSETLDLMWRGKTGQAKREVRHAP